LFILNHQYHYTILFIFNPQNIYKAQALQDVQENVIRKLTSRIDKLEMIQTKANNNTTSSLLSPPSSSSFSQQAGTSKSELGGIDSTTSQHSDAAGENDILDPVSIGDYVLFNASELDNCGYLHGDLASVRLGLQEADVRYMYNYLYLFCFLNIVCSQWVKKLTTMFINLIYICVLCDRWKPIVMRSISEIMFSWCARC
jgi:hypothetical protein